MGEFPLKAVLVLAYSSITHNTVVLTILLILALLFIGYLILQVLFWYLNLKGKLFITSIQLPVIDKEAIEETILQMSSIFSSLHGTILSPFERLFIEILKADKYITIQLGSNKKHILLETKRLFIQLTNVTFTDGEDKIDSFRSFKARTLYTSKNFLPIGKSAYFYDGLINFLSSLAVEKQGRIQLILRGVNKKFFIERKIIQIENKIKQEKRIRPTETEIRLLEGYNRKVTENLFRTKINVFATDDNDVKTLKSLFQSLNLYTNNWYSYAILLSVFIKKRFLAQESLFDFIPILREINGSYLTSSEISFLLHPTNIQVSRYQPEKRNNIEATPEYIEERETNLQIGSIKTLSNTIQPVYFPISNFASNLYIIGKTGRGKSTLLKDIVVSLIDKLDTNGEGNIFVFDPHSELIQDIINESKQSKQIVYLPLETHSNRVFTFNPLFCFQKSEYEKAARRDMILEIIKSETKDETGANNVGTPTLSYIKTAIEIAIEFADAYFNYLITKRNLTNEQAEKQVNARQLTLNDLPFLYIKEMGYE